MKTILINKIFLLIGAFIMLVFFGFIDSAQAATSVTKGSITWTFDGDYVVGQFVTGDWYVVASSGLSIINVSPASLDGRNGSMVNPVPGVGQALDSTGRDYESVLAVSFPLFLSPNDSLISSISIGTETTNWVGRNFNSSVKLKAVAILTVLSSIPDSGTFRPCISDVNKTLYNIGQINYSVLPEKSMQNITNPVHASFDTIEYFERGLEHPWVLFGADWQARAIHPIDHMYDYHEQIGFFLSEAMLLLMTNVQDKTTLLHRFIQTGIDYYHSGTADSSVWAAPVVATGLLINEPDMYNFWIDNPDTRTSRGHEKLYYIGDRNEPGASSIIAEGETWVDWVSEEGKYVAFSKQNGEEYEHLHPSEWTCYSPHCKSEVYRTQHDVYPLIGMALTTILLDRKTDLDVNAMLNHDPIRDYSDRWMSNVFEADIYGDTGRTYREEMEYHTDFTIYSYRYGSGGSAFVNDMWDNYRDLNVPESSVIRANVNQDSSINTIDAILTLRNSLGLSMTGTAWQSSVTTGDVNCDDNSNSSDAMLILRYSLGLDMSETSWCE